MISIIAAIGKNNELGKDNDLIWHLKKDLQYFKANTLNKKIVMGLNTFNSLKKRLVDREYIVLSKPKVDIPDALVYDDANELIKYLKTLDEEVMIIGGASVYKLFIPYADKLYLTEINASAPADVFFPSFDKSKYNKVVIETNNDEDLDYAFVVYEKK